MDCRLGRAIIDRLVVLLIAIPILAFWWLVALGLTAGGETLAAQIMGHPVVDPGDEFHAFSSLFVLFGPPVAMWFSLVRLNDAVALRKSSSAAGDTSERG